MQFSITLLGTSSAVPQPGRFTSAQVLHAHERLYLIDCGEGTQMRMSDFQVRRSKIDQIFISHLHGDHFFGLIGLLTSYALYDRKEPIDIFSPSGLEEIVKAMSLPQGGGGFPFPLRFHIVDTAKHQLIFEDKILRVYSLPLAHRIPTSGYLFVEKERPRSIRPEKIKEYDIPYKKIPGIKQGADLELPGGQVIPNAELTTEPPTPRSYAYCSDTRFKKDIVPMIEGVDVLYHEATFMQSELQNAIETMHSTASEAAAIAKQAGARKLVLGHFSTRYKDIQPLLNEARAVFPDTLAGFDGMTVEVPFR